MPMVRVGCVPLFYQIQGKDDTLILVSGSTASSGTCFFHQTPGLAQHHCVTAIDTRGRQSAADDRFWKWEVRP